MRIIRTLAIAAAGIVVATSAAAQTAGDTRKMENTKAVIETKYGNMTIKFFPDAAPGHVQNFVKLAKKGSTTARSSTASFPAS